MHGIVESDEEVYASELHQIEVTDIVKFACELSSSIFRR
jgi:hypothetical protein